MTPEGCDSLVIAVLTEHDLAERLRLAARVLLESQLRLALGRPDVDALLVAALLVAPAPAEEEQPS